MYTQKQSMNSLTTEVETHFSTTAISAGTKRRRLEKKFNEIPVLDKLNYLQFPVLKVLKENELDILNRHALVQKFGKKSFIYLPFENRHYVYFVKKGNIEIGYLDDDGKELTLDILGPGEIFGSSFGTEISNDYARALDDTMVCVIRKDIFEEFLHKYPQLTLKLLNLLSLRINTLENKMQNLVFKDVKTRICNQLIRLYKKSGDERSGRIRIPLTHQDVAKLVGSTRETASVCLAELRKDGIISYRRQRIFILSLNQLLRQMN